jgi:hypothetical protein
VDQLRGKGGKFTCAAPRADVAQALERFRKFCRFEPETGCVVWTGGQTMGRGHHVPYGAFKYDGRRWFAHRWAAKFIHGFDIDGYQVDHCCDQIPLPNTLCVQHVQPLSAKDNRALQHERRKLFIHLEVGLLNYEDVYGPPLPDEPGIPWHSPPAWLNHKGPTDAAFHD